jgi:hypothetical protein
MAESPWLTVGRTYVVIEVYADCQKPIFLRVMCDDGRTPGLEDCRQFETIDSTIPSDWSIRADARGLRLGPKEFREAGFWEAFFDGNGAAVAKFHEVWSRLQPPANGCIPEQKIRI